MKRADIKTIKKACVLFNKIASVRALYSERDVVIRVNTYDEQYCMGADYEGDPSSEGLMLEIIIKKFLKFGELCYDKNDHSKSNLLIIYLKTVD